MNTKPPFTLRTALVAALLLCALFLGLLAPVGATDTDSRLVDRSKLECSTGTAIVDTTAATWTAWAPIITIVPDGQHALQDVRVTVDLAKATTGFANATDWDAETIQLTTARRVDGTNYRPSANVATTAISATNAAGLSLELFAGDVGPTERLRIYAKVSAQTGLADFQLPYVITYRSGVRATITASAAD